MMKIRVLLKIIIKVKEINIKDIHEAGYNPRTISNTELTKLKNIRIILIVIVILLSTTLIYNLITTPKGNENITTKLNNDTDFLNWFIDFDNLYKKNIPTIDYSLNKDMFTKICLLFFIFCIFAFKMSIFATKSDICVILFCLLFVTVLLL